MRRALITAILTAGFLALALGAAAGTPRPEAAAGGERLECRRFHLVDPADRAFRLDPGQCPALAGRGTHR